jgi:hypothetical protein
MAMPLNNVYSVVFDGVDEHVVITSDSSIDNIFYGGGTIAGWYEFANPIISGERLWRKNNHLLRTNGSTNILFYHEFSTTAGVWRTTDGVITDGEWFFIAATYDSSDTDNDPIFYVNEDTPSVSETGTPEGTVVSDAANNLFLSFTSSGFDGNQDNITIWNKILSPSEIAELYNSGVPTDPTEHSAAANLVTWFPMGDGDTYPTLTDNVGDNDGTMVNMVAGNIVEDALPGEEEEEEPAENLGVYRGRARIVTPYTGRARVVNPYTGKGKIVG